MNDTAPSAGPSATSASKGALPGWAWGLALLAIVVMGVGLALPYVGGSGAAPTGGGTASELVRGLGASAEPAKSGGAGAGTDWASYSPAVFRLGFSFFAAFAIGYALRAFFGFAVAAIGFFFLALYGMQYAGLLEVKWGLVTERADELAHTAAAQAKSFTTMVTGYLPSGGAAATGLFAGWRRKA